MRYVRNTEYLRFLIESRQEYRLPDHMKDISQLENQTFVTGLRSSDAVSYVDWLNKSHILNWSLISFSEAEELNLSEAMWTKSSQGICLFSPIQKMKGYLEEFQKLWLNSLNEDFACDFDLTLHRFVNRNTLRDEALEIVRNRHTNSKIQRYLRTLHPSSSMWDISISDVFSKATQWKCLAIKFAKSPGSKKFLNLIKDLEVAIRECEEIWLLRAYIMTFHNSLHMLKEINNQIEIQKLCEDSLTFYHLLVLIDLRIKGVMSAIEHLVITEVDR